MAVCGLYVWNQIPVYETTDLINRFHSTTLLCLSSARSCILIDFFFCFKQQFQKFEYVCFITRQEKLWYVYPKTCICPHHLVLASYYQVCNTTGAPCGAGTSYPSAAPPVICVVRVVRSLVFCVVFCRLLFVLLSFSLIYGFWLQVSIFKFFLFKEVYKMFSN